LRPNASDIIFFSGEIDVLNSNDQPSGQFKFGYFEIKCKLPVHKGAFPAFWMWGGSLAHGGVPGWEEEIDIFEYAYGVTLVEESPAIGSPKIFTTGIWYNNTCVSNEAIGYARNYPVIPENEPDLTEWNTFACEWSPGRVIWYFNNKVVNEHYGFAVPNNPMWLKTNYALDNFVISGEPPLPTQDWCPDEMTVDYIKVYKLKCDCNNTASITNNTELTAYDYKVKKSLSIGSLGNNITIPSSSKVVFRATDFIEITQNFELPTGSELELITHDCPE